MVFVCVLKVMMCEFFVVLVMRMMLFRVEVVMVMNDGVCGVMTLEWDAKREARRETSEDLDDGEWCGCGLGYYKL